MPEPREYPEQTTIDILDKFLMQDGATDEVKHALFETFLDQLLPTWTSWTPTLANVDPAKVTVTAGFTSLRDTILWRLKLEVTGTSPFSGTVSFSLPAAIASNYGGLMLSLGTLVDTGTQNYAAVVNRLTDSTVDIRTLDTDATPEVTFSGSDNIVNGTTPFTFVVGDFIYLNGLYQKA